jgi:hypothetical protein
MIQPECELGYTTEQLKEIIDNMLEFDRWMNGQTRAICEGRKYNHDTREWEVACDGVAHGLVTYQSDVERYLAGAEVID